MTDGKSDTIAWFAAFAPYDKPRYAICVMVQGGKGGGAVAAPIANRILERALALEDGRFEQKVAWLDPAQKPDPFAFIEAIDFGTGDPNLPGAEGGDPAAAQAANVQLAAAGPNPDVEPEADARGQVPRRQRVVRAQPVRVQPQTTQRRPGFFQRLFGRRPPPQPQPPPQRRTRREPRR
jgi:penicillin-binding protein 2